MEGLPAYDGLSLGWDFHHHLQRKALEQTQDMEKLRELALQLLESNKAQRRIMVNLMAQNLGLPTPHPAG